MDRRMVNAPDTEEHNNESDAAMRHAVPRPEVRAHVQWETDKCDDDAMNHQ